MNLSSITPCVKKGIILSFTFLLLISSLNLNAQRRSKNKIGYGLYTSVPYTASGYGVNYDLNFNAIANKQRFGVGVLMVTSKEILSGANAYYRYNFAENPRLFTRRSIVGLDFFVQAHLIWRVTPVTYSEYIANPINKSMTLVGRKDYISAIEFLVGPGAQYSFNQNFSVDFSIGVGNYLNSPKFNDWDPQKRGASGLNYSCRLGLGYRF
jgi:hypothetical protein